MESMSSKVACCVLGQTDWFTFSFLYACANATKAGIMVLSPGHVVVPVVSHLCFLSRLVGKGNFITAYGVTS